MASDSASALTAVRKRAGILAASATPALRSTPPLRRTTTKATRWLPAVGIAASIAAVAVFVVTQMDGRFNTDGASSNTLQYVTKQAQRAKIELADGSMVLLAPESRLTVSANFGNTTRRVQLDGEALFTVPRSDGQPFVVNTAGAETRVLGTMFTVRRYESDAGARVMVAEGKVAVAPERNAEPGVLTIGEEAVVVGDSAISVRSNVDVATSLAWTQGELVFTSTPLSEVLADTRRLFGFDVQLANKLADEGFEYRKISGKITEQMRPNDAAQLLAGILGVRVVRDGSTYKLTE